MKYLITLMFSLILIQGLLSQNHYEPGYFVDLEGIKREVLIFNKDWKNNPTSFKYKKKEQSEIVEKSIFDIRAFGITGICKFERHVVNIDRSDQEIKDYTYSSEPIFTEEELCLRVLVDGPVSLYKYEDNRTRRFFYKTDGKIKPLIYKKYKTKSDRIAINYAFRGQLWSILECGDFDMDALQKLEYKEKDLIEAVRNFLECSDQSMDYIEKAKKFKKTNIVLKGGLRLSTFNLSIASADQKGDKFNSSFDPIPQFTFGLEVEYILPFRNHVWTVFSDPSYQSYKKTEEKEFLRFLVQPTDLIVEYQSIEIPVGFKYYFPLNKKAKLNINASLVADLFLSNSYILMDRYPDFIDDPINSYFSSNFGIGFQYDQKYLIEFKMNSKRDLLAQFLDSVDANYRFYGINIGYTIF